MNEQAVKYSWQMGPYPKAEQRCNHRSESWPHNDTWAVFQCDGERDECICRQCGATRSFRCNFDEEFN